MGGIGTEGNYRSSSTYATGSVNVINLNFTAGNVNPLNGWYRSNAYSVRCVQHLRAVSGRIPTAGEPSERMTALRPGVAEVRAFVSVAGQIQQSADGAPRRCAVSCASQSMPRRTLFSLAYPIQRLP